MQGLRGAAVPGIKRGCGYRKAGGVYLECNGSPYGSKPMNDFLLDPPLPLAVDCKRGVELQERQGTTMILDFVGASNYPFASDFIVEGMKYGFSRLVSKNLDFSRIQPGSRLLLVHEKGLVTNPEGLRTFVTDAYNTPVIEGRRKPLHRHNCLKLERTGLCEHYEDDFPECIRDLWCLPEATRTVEENESVRFFRDFASVSYEVYPSSPNAPKVETTSALIAALPITNISVIRSPDGSHKTTASVLEEKLGGAISLSIAEG